MVADFVDELWMRATGAARVKGTRAAVGLARRPRAIVERVAANMVTVVGFAYRKGREKKDAEWRF
jgi:hypothetical protein